MGLLILYNYAFDNTQMDGRTLPSTLSPLGCCKMHFHPLIKAIVFPSVPLGEPMNMCAFRRNPKILRTTPPPPPRSRVKGWKCIL